MTDVTPIFKEPTRDYSVARAEVDERSKGLCEVRIPGVCTGQGQEHHHIVKRRFDRAHRSLVHACSRCHQYIHADEGRARENGWISRTFEFVARLLHGSDQ